MKHTLGWAILTCLMANLSLAGCGSNPPKTDQASEKAKQQEEARQRRDRAIEELERNMPSQQ